MGLPLVQLQYMYQKNNKILRKILKFFQSGFACDVPVPINANN